MYIKNVPLLQCFVSLHVDVMKFYLRYRNTPHSGLMMDTSERVTTNGIDLLWVNHDKGRTVWFSGGMEVGVGEKTFFFFSPPSAVKFSFFTPQMDKVFLLVSLVGEVFFLQKLPFCHRISGPDLFFFSSLPLAPKFWFLCTPQVSEVFFLASTAGEVFFSPKNFHPPPPISNGAGQIIPKLGVVNEWNFKLSTQMIIRSFADKLQQIIFSFYVKGKIP